MVWPALCQNLGSVRQKRMRVFLLFSCVAVLAGGAVVLARSTHSTADAHTHRQEDKALRLVHVVFRHGQRTPADTYPNDVYINHTFAPFGLGQLTNIGKKFQYDTGVFLRNRFDKFLGPLYSSGQVFAQSTQPDRAQISCMLTVAGMWPPKGTELDWNPNINWNPITVKFEPLDQDTLLLARKDCPRYYEAREKVFQSPEVLQIFKDNADLLKQLTEITGMNIENPDDVQSLYSTLKAEEGFGLVLPKWTKDYYPHKLEPLTEVSFILNAYNSELQKLKGGPLVKKLISDWSAKAANKLTPPERKIFVYSGHDSTVSNLLLTLGAWDKQVPNYGIMVIFELYENLKTNEFGVEFFLRNSTTAEPVQLTIPGCDAHCPLTKLIEITKNVVPENWPVDCKSNDPNYVPPAPGGP